MGRNLYKLTKNSDDVIIMIDFMISSKFDS